jgi:EAL domain-containing protein (putative c-di-GMP-specific phosphodiesterase class I)
MLESSPVGGSLERDDIVLTYLADALENREFNLVYQPIIDSKTHTIAALEALLRWKHPVHGAISPTEFIAVAESSSLIVAIGDWVIEAVCRQLNEWSAAGYDAPRVCVNASARQFEDPGFAGRVERFLRESDIAADRIELELTETCPITDFDTATRTMAQLRSAGIALSIDDFGAGWTSLNLACMFPMRTLKIDRCLTSAIASDHRKQAIVSSVVSMGRSLGMRTVAEGVDSSESALVLAQMGCDELQGHYFAQPLSADRVVEAFYSRFSDSRLRSVA